MLDENTVLQEVESSKKYFPLRPSNAGKCARFLAYELMDYMGYAQYEPEKKEAETIRLLRLGSSVEYQTIREYDDFAKRNPDYQIRYKQNTVTLFRLSTGPLVEGSMDLTVTHPKYGNCIPDVKSRKDKWHSHFKSQWDSDLDQFSKMKTLEQIDGQGWFAPDLEAFLTELNDPFFASNFLQINTYLNSQWAKEHDMHFGLVHRVNKNDSRQLEIRFSPSEKLFNDFRDKCERVAKAVEKRKPELVKPDCFLGSIQCAFNPKSKACWPADQLKAYFGTLGKKDWPKDTNRLGATGKKLESIMDDYRLLVETQEKLEATEQDILKILVDENIKKVRFADQSIWEVRVLKSPREHFVLRRTKL